MLDDTTAEALAVQLEVLRRIGLQGRAAMTFELSDNLRRIVKDGVRHHHPDWDEKQVKQEVFRIVLGDRLYHEAFGESPSSDE
jgi:hypothetical protein